jgi:hypothetical protein
MKKRQKLLTDEQWELIDPLLPERKRCKDGRGHPPALNRNCSKGILWILQTGAAWHFLPDEYRSPFDLQAAAEAVGGGRSLAQARRTLLGTLDEKGSLFEEFTFSDRLRLQFRAEAFNTANTPQFKTAGNLNFENATNFCKITSERGTPRLVRFALKLYDQI